MKKQGGKRVGDRERKKGLQRERERVSAVCGLKLLPERTGDRAETWLCSGL